jgi:hypothetical protein
VIAAALCPALGGLGDQAGHRAPPPVEIPLRFLREAAKGARRDR